MAMKPFSLLTEHSGKLFPQHLNASLPQLPVPAADMPFDG